MLALLVACVAVLVAVRASRASAGAEIRVSSTGGGAQRLVARVSPAATHWKLWMCVHSREASWTDPNAPYYGGLQMGWWFMRTYAPRELARWGTADRWSPAIQVWVAERAYAREHYSRSWLEGQWPQTSPPCLAYA